MIFSQAKTNIYKVNITSTTIGVKAATVTVGNDADNK